MFGWISDRLSSSDEARSSVASPRTARALIVRLEIESPQYATEELAKQYHGAPREVLAAPNGVRALQLLDEWAQAPLAKLWQTLLADMQGQTVKESVWAALARYYRRSFLAYWQALGLGVGSTPAKAEGNASTHAARSMAAFGKYMLLQRMRYLAVAEESWAHVWRLMNWADEQKLAAAPTSLYERSTMAESTTVEREFLLALLTEVAPTGNLLPGQMLGLDHVLRRHAGRYVRARQFDAQSAPFSYELARGAPPQRHLPGLRVHDGMLFFGPGTAHAEICTARDEAHKLLSLPSRLAELGCSTDNYIELLERLAAHWSPAPPRRRHRREACTGEILVAHDLPTIRRLIKFSELAVTGQSLGYDAGNIYKSKGSVRMYGDGGVQPDGRSANVISEKEALANLETYEKSLGPGVTETWQLSDSSESGLGARVAPDCAWVKIGMVIAYRPRESVDWQVALVRRLSRTAPGQLLIGMARISGKVRSARLRRGIGSVDYCKASAGAEVEYDAISLKDATTSLILPVGIFDKSQKYTLTCEDKQHVVTMEKSIERRPNFECVQISEVELLRAA